MSRIGLRPNIYEDNKICSECANAGTSECPRVVGRRTRILLGIYKEPYGVHCLMSEKDGKGIFLTITDCISFERCFFLSDIFKFLLNI